MTPSFVNPQNYYIWYPPIAPEEEAINEQNLREKIIKKLNRKLGISLGDYPKDKPIYVWKIAEILKLRARES